MRAGEDEERGFLYSKGTGGLGKVGSQSYDPKNIKIFPFYIDSRGRCGMGSVELSGQSGKVHCSGLTKWSEQEAPSEMSCEWKFRIKVSHSRARKFVE